MHVLTYHRSKGLEWPVVIATDFEYEERMNLWDVRVDLTADFDPNSILKTLPKHAVTLILEEQMRAFGEDDPIIDATLEEMARPKDGEAHPLDALIEGLEE